LARTNLTFSGLRRAITGNTSGAFRLAADGRGSAATTAMINFAIDSITGVTGPTEMEEGNIENFYFTFSSAGSLFTSKLGSRSANSDWGFDQDILEVDSNNGDDCDIAAYNGGGEEIIFATWTDYFNINATNYNSARSIEVGVSAV